MGVEVFRGDLVEELAELLHLVLLLGRDGEAGLVEQVVAPHKRGRDAAAKARAEETVSEIAALSVRLHATLVKAGLRSS